MRTITATVGAWLSSSFGPKDISGGDARAISNTTFTDSDMTSHGWTRIGTAEITLHIEDEEKIVLNKVESLKAEKNNLLAEAQHKATRIDEQINSLLAISYTPEVES